MLEKLRKTVVRVCLAVAGVVAFFVLIELLRAYQTLHGLLPAAGYVFLAVVVAALAWLILRLLGGWRLRPRTLRPPAVDDVDRAPRPVLRKYGRYLAQYLRRLSRNPALAENRCAEAAGASADLAVVVRRCRDEDELRSRLQAAEAEHVEPLLAELDALAEGEVQNCVLDVMIGVAVSPWNAVDVLVVLYRNGSMISRVTGIYNAQPPLWERLSILADTVRIVAMIKFASLTGGLLRHSKRLPGVGRAIEPLVQAVGAGVLTSAAGHAAMHRCRAFRGWSRQAAADDLGSKVGRYLQDCWKAALNRVMPILRETLVSVSNEAWNGVKDSVGAAVKATAEAADSLVRKPVAKGIGVVANGGGSVFSRTRSFMGRTFGRRRSTD